MLSRSRAFWLNEFIWDVVESTHDDMFWLYEIPDNIRKFPLYKSGWFSINECRDRIYLLGEPFDIVFALSFKEALLYLNKDYAVIYDGNILYKGL